MLFIYINCLIHLFKAFNFLKDIQDFVAYVAKDEDHGRACYVFECSGGNLANNVITTIGHAFELRFKNFLSSNLQQNNNPNSTTSDNS